MTRLSKEIEEQIEQIFDELSFMTVSSGEFMFESTCKEMGVVVYGGSFEAALSGCIEEVRDRLRSPVCRKNTELKINSPELSV